MDEAFVSDGGALEKIRRPRGARAAKPAWTAPGAARARKLALQGTRQWGRCAFVGEGSDVQFDVSPLLIHPQITLYGSWVTSLGHMRTCWSDCRAGNCTRTRPSRTVSRWIRPAKP